MAQAMDESVPLLERLRYLCISCTNLTSSSKSVAGVLHMQEFGTPLPPDGIPPSALLKLIHERAGTLVEQQYRYWREVLRPALADAGIRILSPETWNARQKRWLKQHFNSDILPVLRRSGWIRRTCSRASNKSLNVVVVLQGKDAFGRAGKMAIVRAPRSLPRIIQLPPSVSGGEHDFVLLSAVLSSFVDELFPGMQVKGAYQFRDAQFGTARGRGRGRKHRRRGAGRAARPRFRARDAAGDRRQRPRPIINTLLETSICRPMRSTASTARSTSTASPRSTIWSTSRI